MENKKNSAGTIALVVLLLIVTIASLILATFAWAKYTTTAPTQTATANVAKWNVTFTNGGTFTQSYSHVTSGKIAPGTSGTITIQPVANNTETCFDYTIHIDSIRLLNGSTPLSNDTVLLAEDGSNAAVTVADVLSHISLKSGTWDLKSSPTMTGSYELKDTAHNNTTSAAFVNKSSGAAFANDNTYTIEWEWPYSTTGNESVVAAYDRIDTAAGQYAAGNTSGTDNDLKLEVKYTCTAVQTNPAFNTSHEPTV